MFIGRADVEAETPILWPPHAKSWLIGKDPDAGKDWEQEEKEMTEDEMAGWHHRLDGQGFLWTLGVGDGQGGLACCDSWGHKESNTTEWLNWIVNTRVLVTCTISVKLKDVTGETVETVADFILLGSKITADGDCSYEIKRCLLPGRKVMTNLDSILKSRDTILSTKSI